MTVYTFYWLNHSGTVKTIHHCAFRTQAEAFAEAIKYQNWHIVELYLVP